MPMQFRAVVPAHIQMVWYFIQNVILCFSNSFKNVPPGYALIAVVVIPIVVEILFNMLKISGFVVNNINIYNGFCGKPRNRRTAYVFNFNA